MNKNYRPNVGIMIIDNNKNIFVGQRLDHPSHFWQMPQGGVDKGEDYLTAAYRELEEETSIKNVDLIKELDGLISYKLPKNLLGIIWKGKYRGQRQKWFIVKYLGKDSEININTKNPEFIEWKWLDIKKLTSVIVDFKKKVYEKL